MKLSFPLLAAASFLSFLSTDPVHAETFVCPNDPGAGEVQVNVQGGSHGWSRCVAYMQTTLNKPANSVATTHKQNGASQFGKVNFASAASMRSSDTGNVKYPPLTLNRWKLLHAPNGILPIGSKLNRAFRCPSVQAARSVIRLIPPVRNRGAANPQQLRGFAVAIKKHGCRPTTGRYLVTSLHENAFISLGYEAGEDWTALTVKQGNTSGIGLVYDASFD